MNFARHYLLALQFFTRVPVTGVLARWAAFSPDGLRASTAHFPGVGLVVGGLSALVFWLLDRSLPTGAASLLAAAVLSTAAGVLCTGAFHEDALADVADGLGGSPNRERALEIMKDSRVGAFGAVAVVLALLSKVTLLAALASVAPAVACGAIVVAHVISRGAALPLIRSLPYVADQAHSKSKLLADHISRMALVTGLAWCLAALALATPWLPMRSVACGVAFLIAIALWMWRLFAKRLQGITGDCLGATQQVCEIGFYLGMAIWR